MAHTLGFKVSQIQEYTCIPIECNGTPSKFIEDVYTIWRQIVQFLDWLKNPNEVSNGIFFFPHESGRGWDICIQICQAVASQDV